MTDVEAPGVPEATGAPAPRRRTALWVAVSLGGLLALLVAVLATRQPAEARLADSPLLGKPAPAFAGTPVVGGDGRAIDSTQLEGRWVVLNFFASWCVPCKQEHPEIVKFVERHRAAGDAQVISVLWDDSPARARAFFAANGGDWPVLADPGVHIGLDYGVRGPPESYVISPSGVVVAKYVGPLTADSLERVLSGARAQR